MDVNPDQARLRSAPTPIVPNGKRPANPRQNTVAGLDDDTADRLASLLPGPHLSTTLAGVPATGLSSAERVLVAQARARQLCYDQAALLESVWELALTAWTSDEGAAPMRAPDEFSADQVAMTLTWSRPYAQHQIDIAGDLIGRLPQVMEAMRTGQLDVFRATAFSESLRDLDDDTARAVADRLLPKAPMLTPGHLRDRLRYHVHRADPEAAKRRYVRRVAQRCVYIGPERSGEGTAAVIGTGLPAHRAAEADNWLNRVARAAKRAGDLRTLSQLRADAALDLLSGRPLATIPSLDDLTAAADIASRIAHSGARQSAEFEQSAPIPGSALAGSTVAGSAPAASAPAGSTPAGSTPAGSTPAGAASAGSAPDGSPATGQPTNAPAAATELSGSAWSDRCNHCGAAHGVPTIGADAPDWPNSDPDRYLPAHWVDEVGERFPHDLFQGTPGHDIARDGEMPATAGRPGEVAGPGPGPWAREGICEIIVSLETLMRINNDPGIMPGWGPVVADVARQVAHDPRYARWQFNIIDATGRLLTQVSTRRRPNTEVSRFVDARDRTCRAPGCRRRAVYCDRDHNIPFALGGPTSEDNLCVLCRHHHRLKHERGLTCNIHPVTGTVWWRLPDGRLFLTPNDGALYLTGSDLDDAEPRRPTNQATPTRRRARWLHPEPFPAH